MRELFRASSSHADATENFRQSVIRRWGPIVGEDSSICLKFASTALDVVESARDSRLKLLNAPHALMDILAHVVRSTPEMSSGLEMFRRLGGDRVFNEFVSLLDGTTREQWDSMVLTAHLVDVVHVGWLLNEFERCRSLAEVLRSRVESNRLAETKLWRNYAAGVVAVYGSREYSPLSIELRGAEKHWYMYMNLLSALLSGEPVEKAIEGVDNSFRRRNRDRRLYNIGFADGSGRYPVIWDFRKYAILELRTYIKLPA